MVINCLGILSPEETIINILGGYLSKELQEKEGVDAEEAKKTG